MIPWLHLISSLIAFLLIHLVLAKTKIKRSNLCSLEYDEFHQDQREFISISNVTEEQDHLRQLTYFISLYQYQHGIRMIQSESDHDFCQRKFVVNRMFILRCDGYDHGSNTTFEGVGGTYGQILNELAGAVVMNRTFVLSSNDNLGTECTKYIGIKRWIPTYDYIRKRLTSANCLGNFDDFQSIASIGFGHFHMKEIESVKTIIMAGESISKPFCTFHPVYGMNLSSYYRNRANILLYNNRNPLRSRYEGYGFLFRSIFKFKLETQIILRPLLEDIYHQKFKKKTICVKDEQMLVIGVHLRHQNSASINNSAIDEEFDLRALRYIYNLTENIDFNKCIVIIASDRLHSIRFVENYAKSISCEIRSASLSIPMKTPQVPDLLREHGN